MKEINKNHRNYKHGLSRTVEYKVWTGLVNRCTRPTNPAWKNYGGRGIQVCPEWENDFFCFLEDMGRRPTENHQLDRRDNEKGYNRDNCRWVSHKENSRNRRSARLVTYLGREMCLSEACELAGLPRDTVKMRIDGPKKWPVEKALSTPIRFKSKKGRGPKPAPMTNRTGFKGVKKIKNGYVAALMTGGGKKIYSPRFVTPDAAAAWYREMRAKHPTTYAKRKSISAAAG